MDTRAAGHGQTLLQLVKEIEPELTRISRTEIN
jgi:hypothetical protein